MKNLVHFSLKYDCTESLLEVLAENCSRSLRILDIERSQQVKGWSNCRLSDVCFNINIFNIIIYLYRYITNVQNTCIFYV